MRDHEDPLVLQPATINPYRTAAGLVLRRLMWDIHPKSWASRHTLSRMKNTYAGKKAVIMCNGPSLLRTDFDSLKGCYVFGLNKINLLFDKTDLRPSCIVAVNPLVIEQNCDFYNETDIPLFIDSASHRYVSHQKGRVFLHSTPLSRFARDCSLSIVQGYTVTYVAMQLAFHMGFQEVGIVGCDHQFAVSGPANKTVTSEKEDASHFDPRYFAGGVKWQLPDLYQSEIYYTLAKNVYQAFGRRIVNCTEGGALEVFERMPLSDFLRD